VSSSSPKICPHGTTFYRDPIGLAAKADPEYDPSDWIDSTPAAHPSRSTSLTEPPRRRREACAHKLVFYAKDVNKARTALLKKKVEMGQRQKIRHAGALDGTDPDGNKIRSPTAFNIPTTATPRHLVHLVYEQL